MQKEYGSLSVTANFFAVFEEAGNHGCGHSKNRNSKSNMTRTKGASGRCYTRSSGAEVLVIDADDAGFVRWFAGRHAFFPDVFCEP
jgi:hypothetical protein